MILALLALASTVAAYPGIVTVDSASAKPGQSVTLAVRLANNNIKISSMLLPLKYNPAVLTLDSVSFDPTFKPDGITGYYSNDIANHLIRIIYVPVIQTPIDTIVASSGVLARLHFRVALSAAPQFSKVDSLYSDELLISGTDTTHITTRVEFSDNTGIGIYLPGFVPGGVTVLVPTGVDETNGAGLPSTYALDQNYPNPFNPSTTIRFDLPSPGQVRLEVYNLLGQSVGVLAEGRYPAGSHLVTFAGENLPSGVYFYRFSHEGGSETRKMLLLK